MPALSLAVSKTAQMTNFEILIITVFYWNFVFHCHVGGTCHVGPL